MTRPPRKQRTIRVEDDLWTAALAKADERRETLAEVVREFLRRYVRGE